MAHDYNGVNASRAMRKQSKLGPGIITAERLDELLGIGVCPRCKRGVNPWPLARGGRCSPPDWGMCIRNDDPADWGVTGSGSSQANASSRDTEPKTSSSRTSPSDTEAASS